MPIHIKPDGTIKQPTKRMRPIDLVIQDENLAKLLWHVLNNIQEVFEGKYPESHKHDCDPKDILRAARVLRNSPTMGTHWSSLEASMKAENIDPWVFNVPIMIDKHEVKFGEKGIQIGCTYVDKETVLAIAKKLQ